MGLATLAENELAEDTDVFELSAVRTLAEGETGGALNCPENLFE